MDKFLSYSKWSLRKQLQVIFITSYVIVISLYVLMTLLQLNWLQEYLETNSYTVVRDNIEIQMKTLVKAQVAYTVVKLESLSAFLSIRKTMAEAQLGFSNISNSYFDPAYAINSKNVPIDEKNVSYGYYSRHLEISEEGKAIVSKMAGLNKILPDIFNDNVYTIYEGFYTDEILNFCPLSFFESSDYSPLAREWFYKAIENAPNNVITEPYYDALEGILLITGSVAIMNGTEKFGVTAVDITVEDLSSDVSKLRILDNGKVFMVSAGGIILNPPIEFHSNRASRIYNESLTGISYTEWEKIKSYETGTIFTHNIKNFGECLLEIEHLLSPATGKAIYYIIGLVKIKETKKSTEYISDSFNKIHTVLIWSTSVISILFLLASMVFIYFSSRKVADKLGEIKKILDTIIVRACFVDITKKCDFDKIKENDAGIKNLVEGCKEKVKVLKEEEKKVKDYKWNETRPSNFLIYTKWRERIYPFNRFSGKVESWERAIEHIHNNIG